MTSPLSPEAVAQMVADLPSRWKDAAPNPHYRGEELLPIVYADPGSNGWYYRERKPDSVTAYVRVDLITTLAAENATLRAERDEARKIAAHDTALWLASETVVATLRASEAAAMERLRVMADAVGDLGDDLTYFPELTKHNLHQRAYDIALAALTTDKEPKT